jgi:putative thioredoxin
MSHQPFTAAALRGAVDLSSLKRPDQPDGPGSAAAATSSGGAQLVVEGTDASLRDIVASSARHPVILVLWSSALPQSADLVASFRTVAERYAGRFQLVTVDIDSQYGVRQAFQVQAVPVTYALVQGQPVPLFEGVQPEDQIAPVVDQVLALAAQHGVTGTVSADAATAGDDEAPDELPPLPPLHQKAFDAIEADDLDGAADAYREALAQNPADTDAQLGLAQVGLMLRTKGLDPQAARAAAAAAPTDVDAQIVVADLDLLGGHVEDAFGRLVDTVRVTSDAERNKAREHLVELFDIVGHADERVAKARKALMSALF